MANNASDSSGKNFQRTLLYLVPVVFAALLVLFHPSLEANKVLHANDVPFGAMPDRYDAQQSLTGTWAAKNWLGQPIVSSQLFDWAFLSGPGRLAFAKWYAPFCLLALGVAAAYFFRKLGFSMFVCILGGLAAALNGNMLSNAGWGQYSRPVSLALAFLALAALANGAGMKRWIRSILAGCAVGLGIAHGFDIGAIFSLYVAAFVLFRDWVQAEQSKGKELLIGVIRVGVVAVAAGVIAANSLVYLVGSQIKGVSGTEQTAEAKAARWDFATQWSLPKIETLRVIIPGLYGYRMDTPEGGQYWGRVGQSPAWERDKQGSPRGSSGAGEYAGVLVVLLAAYSIVQALRKTNNPFTANERKYIWFWTVLAFFSLIFAWGRFAPFYWFLYQLPYFSTIRNPMKFMHPFHMILLILCAYGLQALYRQYLAVTVTKAESFKAQWSKWWKTAAAPEKKWALGLFATLGFSLLAFLIYSSSVKSLEADLKALGFDAALSQLTAQFTIQEVLLFVVFLAVSIAGILAIMTGWFAGTRAKWAAILLGLILTVDLARSNKPWIIYHDYKYKYATNPILDILRDRPYEHRVTFPNFLNHPDMGLISQLYGIEWLQQNFQYLNIHSIDVIQMPREPLDFASYRGAQGTFSPYNIGAQIRYWELTNTKYFLGPTILAEALNAQLDQGRGRFRIHTGFDIAAKPGVTDVKSLEDLTAIPNPKGRYALIEFTGTLPRAKLYSNWQVSTNDESTLQTLSSPEFKPDESVLVSADTPVPQATGTANENGTLQITRYEPKQIEMSVQNLTSPAVLLLNDRFDPNWKVSVDGKSETLLRANYLMRGVYLQPGNHTVTFRFDPPTKALYVTLAAIVVGLLLCGFLFIRSRRADEQTGAAPTQK